MMGPEARLRLAPFARTRWHEPSAAHMIVYPERALRLNETAARIVMRCDGTRALGDIARELAAESGADPATVLRDVLELAADLVRRRLFVEVRVD